MKIPFLSFTCEDIGVAMVTNMIISKMNKKKLCFMKEFHQYLYNKQNISWLLEDTNFIFECSKYLSRVSEANE